MGDARALVAQAARLYDEPGNGLQAASRAAAWGGFEAGAHWMRCALGHVRGKQPMGRASFGLLGLGKYTLCGLLALVVLLTLGVCWDLTLPAVLAAILVFYVVEARLVFVFPLALDGEATPFLASHRLLGRTLPSGRALARVTLIAAGMLFGGFLGRGFVRSWCIGCLAVVLWYEEARGATVVPT